MDKVKYSSLYGKFKGRNNYENVIKILEKINERNRNEKNIWLFEKNLNLVEEIYKVKEILKNL